MGYPYCSNVLPHHIEFRVKHSSCVCVSVCVCVCVCVCLCMCECESTGYSMDDVYVTHRCSSAQTAHSQPQQMGVTETHASLVSCPRTPSEGNDKARHSQERGVSMLICIWHEWAFELSALDFVIVFFLLLFVFMYCMFHTLWHFCLILQLLLGKTRLSFGKF